MSKKAKPASKSDTNPFWDFSIWLYQKDDVAANCLIFQEETTLNVNILLLCCWAGWHGMAIEPRIFEDLLTRYDPWYHQVILPLRRLRTRMKHSIGAIQADQFHALRAQIKKLELHAEKCQQDFLFHALPQSTMGAEKAPLFQSMILENITLYAKLQKTPLNTASKTAVKAIISRLATEM